ncbi:MAG: SAM-dependent methyltransferase [Chloroflexi bacterium]|nr:SAM-dependent methyltransferase [Chloroflexota bacterium]
MTTESSRGKQRPNPIDRALGGWQPARVLMAANHLDFFTVLGDEALTAGDVASRCGTHPRSTRTLLNACVALGILEKEGDLYRNSAEARESLLRGKPGYIGDAIAHQDDMWQRWGKLHEAVRTNRPVVRDYTAIEQSEAHRNFILAMHNRAMRGASLLAESLDLSGRRQFFDAGGGPGTYSIFLVRRYPGLRAIVFDLPQTIEITKEIIADFGVADLVTTRSGDYFKDDFGQGNDVVLLSAILHSMGPERSQSLLLKAYDSLISGGLVVVHENLISDEGTSPLRAVLFSLNMLVNTGEGQSYSGTEVMSLMEAVGFIGPRVIPIPQSMGASLVISVKP